MDCFLRYSIAYGTLQPCLGSQRATLQRGILRPENPTYTYWRRAARASRGFKMVLFTEPSEAFVGDKCALPSFCIFWRHRMLLVERKTWLSRSVKQRIMAYSYGSDAS